MAWSSTADWLWFFFKVLCNNGLRSIRLNLAELKTFDRETKIGIHQLASLDFKTIPSPSSTRLKRLRDETMYIVLWAFIISSNLTFIIWSATDCIMEDPAESLLTQQLFSCAHFTFFDYFKRDHYSCIMVWWSIIFSIVRSFLNGSGSPSLLT